MSSPAAQGAVMTSREVLAELSRSGRANMLDYARPVLPSERTNMGCPPSRNYFQRLVAWACNESGGS